MNDKLEETSMIKPPWNDTPADSIENQNRSPAQRVQLWFIEDEVRRCCGIDVNLD